MRTLRGHEKMYMGGERVQRSDNTFLMNLEKVGVTTFNAHIAYSVIL